MKKGVKVLMGVVVVLMVVGNIFIGAVSASSPIADLKPPFELEDQDGATTGFPNDYFVATDKNHGKIKAHTFANTFIGTGSAGALGRCGETVYIPVEGLYKLNATFNVTGKIGADNIQIALSSVSGSRIQLFLHLTDVSNPDNSAEVILLDEFVATTDLRDYPQKAVEALAKKFFEVTTGINIELVSPEHKIININGRYPKDYNDFATIWLHEGNWKIYGGARLISTGASFFGQEYTYADFSDRAVYMFDPHPFADEFVKIERIEIIKESGGNAPPRAIFTPSEVHIYVGQEVAFNASESFDYEGWITDYQWEFESGTPSSSNSIAPTVKWNQPGIYIVQLTVRDNASAENIAQGMVTVEDRAATGSISIYPEDPVKLQPIEFTANVNDPDGISSFVWYFGDDESATTTSNKVTHFYESAGNYEAKLMVIDTFGGATEFKKTFAVGDWSSSPNIGIDAVWINGDGFDGDVYLEGRNQPYIDEIRVYYVGHADEVGYVQDYDIRVLEESRGIVIGTDDGNGEDLDDYIRCIMDTTIFREPGLHSLRVIAHHTNGGGAEAEYLKNIDVGVDIDDHFNIFPTYPCAYETIKFDASHLAEDKFGYPIEYYHWKIFKGNLNTKIYETPDGESEPIATVNLQGAGEYIIWLINSANGDGRFIDDETSIWVRESVYYEPSLSIEEFNVPNQVIKEKGCPVTLKLSNTGHEKAHYIIRYKVDGKIVKIDTGYLRKADVDDTYKLLELSKGTHSISIEFVNAHNQLITRGPVTVNVVENTHPTAEIESINPSEIFIGDEVTFTAHAEDSDGEIDEILWNFGDGESGSGQTVGHTYPKNGFYIVTLTVIDDCEASSYDVKEIIVKRANTPPYEPSNPSPSDNATDIPINATLSWSGGDPDGDDVTYDVYFGTDPIPTALVSNNQAEKTFGPTLDNSTHYYWKVIAKDEFGATNESDVWEFTTEEGVHEYGVDLTADPTEKTVKTAVNATYVLTVTNTGTVMDSYTLTVNNIDNAAVASLNRSLVTSLPSGASTTVLLNVTDETQGTYNVSVTATSQGDPAVSDTVMTETTVSEIIPPQIVTYTISNHTIKPPQTTAIDVEFSETVDYRIAIEKESDVVCEWTGTAINPMAKVWDGTYEANGTVVPGGAYTVNVTGTSTTTGLSVVNDTEQITVGPENDYAKDSYIKIVSGTLADQDIDPANPAITVHPEEQISGSFDISAKNTGRSGSIFPIVATPNWGPHETSYWGITGHQAPGIKTHTVTVDIIAPSKPGVCYIIVAGMWELSAANVASGTNWCVGENHWDDGNDLADWSTPKIEEAINSGLVIADWEKVEGMVKMYVPATAIRVKVVTETPKAWLHSGYDPSNTRYYPHPSETTVSMNNFDTSWTSPNKGIILTGDIDGDGKLDLVSALEERVCAMDKEGNQLWSRNIPTDSGISGAKVQSMDLADMNGDGKIEVVVGVSPAESYVKNQMKILFYNGNGNLLENISTPDSKGLRIKCADLDNDEKMEVIAVTAAGYILEPRGVFVYDYNTGHELWNYTVGPSVYPDAIADINKDGNLEIILGSSAPHNGNSDHGTDDSHSYVFAFDKDGNNLWTKQIGWCGVRSSIADLNNDGSLEIISFRLQNHYYPGPNDIHILDPTTGDILDTYNGPTTKLWLGWAIADISGDGKKEIVVDNEDGVLRVLDHDLNLINSKSVGGTVQAINDINGDGKMEIIVCSDDNRLVVLDNELDEAWSYDLGANGNAIVSELRLGGSNEIIVSADKLYVLSGSVVEEIFDTRSGTYPGISGTHNGTITPSCNLIVNKLYTYPCPGTGGHAEYVRIYNASGTLAEAPWNGYVGDWHNLTFNNSFTLYANETYNYTIRTGSYPQIHHNRTLLTESGWINCTEFTDANGVIHDNWIPAVKFFW